MIFQINKCYIDIYMYNMNNLIMKSGYYKIGYDEFNNVVSVEKTQLSEEEKHAIHKERMLNYYYKNKERILAKKKEKYQSMDEDKKAEYIEKIKHTRLRRMKEIV